jgi:pimeloyl-ACP methyl ester carboxylesterase
MPGVVFVHGFRSSARTWDRFVQLFKEDGDLAGLSPYTFSYRSPAASVHPLRAIPTINTVADSLRTFLSRDLSNIERLALVGHSQGGLVVQRLLARVLADQAGAELSRIRLVVMFACPNAGSDLWLSLRRRAWLWRQPQERELRPLNELVTDTHRIVLNQLVHPGRIPVVAYAGASDRVVRPASARSVFPDAQVLPGDHFTIIQPDSHSHPSYVALKHDLLEHGVVEQSGAPSREIKPSEPVSRPRPEARRAVVEVPPEVVEQLLAIPGMTEADFRQRLYRQLPARVREQLPHHANPRVEVVGLVATLSDYQHLDAWEALVTGVRTLLPDHPVVAELVDMLSEIGLIQG